jgi:hypothetical protein
MSSQQRHEKVEKEPREKKQKDARKMKLLEVA